MISSNTDWTIASDVNWISTDVISGSVDTKIDLSIEGNTVNETRKGTLTILGGTQEIIITLNQDASGVLSVQDELKSELLIFPNPTDGVIQLINLPAENNYVHVDVIDLNGRNILSQECQVINGECALNFETLAASSYLMNIKFRKQNSSEYITVSRKFIKK
jgi:hypothetical protein